MGSQNTVSFIIPTPRGDLECELSCERDYGNPDLHHCDYALIICMDNLAPNLNATITLKFSDRAEGIKFNGFGSCFLTSEHPIDFFYNGLELQTFKCPLKSFVLIPSKSENSCGMN